jgi:hypothetical protein
VNGRYWRLRSFMICNLIWILLEGSIRGNKADSLCSTHGRDEILHKILVEKHEETTARQYTVTLKGSIIINNKVIMCKDAG